MKKSLPYRLYRTAVLLVLSVLFSGIWVPVGAEEPFLPGVSPSQVPEQRVVTPPGEQNSAGTSSGNSGGDANEAAYRRVLKENNQSTPTPPAPIDPCSFEAYDGRGVFTLPDCIRPSNAPGFTREEMETAGGRVVPVLISFVAGGIAALSGIIAVIFIMYHGLMLTIAGGDEGKRTESLKRIQWAILGLILVIFAYVTVNVVITAIDQVLPGEPGPVSEIPSTTNTQPTQSTSGTTTPPEPPNVP